MGAPTQAEKDRALILIRFRGQFHELPEGGTFPLGLCPFHPFRIAFYVPKDFDSFIGRTERAGWATAFFQAREVGSTFYVEPFRDMQQVTTRTEAERFLLGGTEAGPCDHFTPRQIAGASRLVDSAAFIHPRGACMKHPHAHDAGDCPDLDLLT